MKLLLTTLLFLPLSVLGQVGMGTTTPEAWLDINTDPNGRAALELVPQSSPVGKDTGQLAVIGDKLYLFDAVRDKWLSIEQTILEFGRLGSGSDPAEVEFGGGDLQNGPRMPFDGTIVSITISATEDNNQRDITLFVNGVAVPNNDIQTEVDGVFILDHSTLRYEDANYNLDFEAGDMLNFAIDSAVTDIKSLTVKINVKWRKDNS